MWSPILGGDNFLFIKGMLARSQKPRLKPRMITALLMIKQLGIILGPGKVTKLMTSVSKVNNDSFENKP